MPNYSTPDVILVRYPFSDLTSAKVRPAVVINAPHPSQDLLITRLPAKPIHSCRVSLFSLNGQPLD